MAVVLVNVFFLFFLDLLLLLSLLHLLPPKKDEAIAFLSQMSYRLTFKFLSEQSDYLIFVLNLTEVSHYNVLF